MLQHISTFGWFAGAVKANPQTSSRTKKEVEKELRKWFGNARDRGPNSRKTLKMNSTVSSTPNTSLGLPYFADDVDRSDSAVW